MTHSHTPDSLVDACRSNYKDARQLFLDSASALGCKLTRYQHNQARGFYGESLYCDMASIGPEQANHKILLSSGVHGAEGYCGSAIQTLIMQRLLPHIDLSDLQIIFVHAINPYGFSHYTRNNEDNIDLNRNFVTFPNKKNNTEEITAFREQAYPNNWQGSDLKETKDKVEEYITQHGIERFQTLMTQGQYIQEQDPYYGGTQASWSNDVWRDICEKYCPEGSQIVHLDIHTGLGPRGACELIYTGNQDKYLQAQQVFSSGKIIAPGSVDSSTPIISGPLCCGLLDVHPQAICIALEFGTIPIKDMLNTLIEANWLYNNPNCNSKEKRRIQQQTLDAFFIADDDWIEQVWNMSETYFMDALQSFDLD